MPSRRRQKSERRRHVSGVRCDNSKWRHSGGARTFRCRKHNGRRENGVLQKLAALCSRDGRFAFGAMYARTRPLSFHCVCYSAMKFNCTIYSGLPDADNDRPNGKYHVANNAQELFTSITTTARSIRGPRYNEINLDIRASRCSHYENVYAMPNAIPKPLGWLKKKY